MKPTELFRTTAVRFALRYTVVYLLILGVALLAFHWTASNLIGDEVKRTIAERLVSMQQVFNAGGSISLVAALDNESVNGPDRPLSLYIDSTGSRLGGNMLAWPDEGEISLDGRVHSAWIDEALIPGDQYNDDAWLPVTATEFPDGTRLLLSQAVDQATVVQVLTEFLIEVLGASFFLALILSLILGRQILRRMETISRTAGNIMEGDLSQRIPFSDRNDEFDTLAKQLNSMLDRIQFLIRGMRDVTDNIAHELRSPLTRLLGRLEVTLLEDRNGEEYRQALRQSIADAEGLIRTFNALLSIAQAEAGNHRDRRQPVDLTVLVQDLAELYEPAAEERQQQLQLSLNACASVSGSRDLLAQAIGNLLENAIKYTHPGGVIQLSVAPDKGACMVKVEDNGPGIPASQREQVLERFVRLEDSVHSTGNGLGLSLVRAVAILHAAELRLDDAYPGLMVTLRFPPD